MSFLRAALARPRTLVLSLLLLSLVVAPLVRRLDLGGDLVDLLPRSSPSAETFGTFSRHLVAGQELLMLATCQDPERLAAFADRYAVEAAKLPDVEQVTHRISAGSLQYLRAHLLLLLDDEALDELERRLQPEALRKRAAELRGLLTAPGAGAMAPLLTADPLELAQLVGKRFQSGLQVDPRSGYLRTADGTALLIKLRPRFSPMQWERGEALLKSASALAVQLGAEVADRSFENAAAPRVGFTGAYAYPPYYRRWLEQDMTLSTVVSVGSVLLLFALFFRSLRILPMVLVPLSAAGLWTAVVAALWFGRLSSVSMAFSSILVAIGIDVPMQLYSRLREELIAHPERPPRELVLETVEKLAAPSILATLGPAAVFFCCGLSDYRGLNQLGVLAGLGLLLNCVAMLTLFPGLLLALPTRLWLRPASVRGAQASRLSDPLAWLGGVVARSPRAVLAVAAVLFVVAAPLALRVRFAEKLFSIEPVNMPPANVQAEISKRFGENQRFLVALIEDEDMDRALYRGDRFQREVDRMKDAGLLRGYEAVSNLVPSAQTLSARRERLRKLDLPAAGVALEKALDEAGFSTAPFAAFLEQLKGGVEKLASPSLDGLAKTELGFLVRAHVAEVPAQPQLGTPARRLVALYLFASAEPAVLEKAVVALKQAAQPLGVRLTGLPLLEGELRSIIEVDMLRVTGASLFAVLALLAITYRRLRPFLSVALPLSLAWVLFAAALYLLGIPLNLYNLLAVPLVIGYGIDDHIFLLHRYRELAPSERDPVLVLRTTGRAIVLTTLTTVAGFGGLLIARFEGLRLLGLSGGLAVLLCLLAAFLVLPALLALLYPRQAGGAGVEK